MPTTTDHGTCGCGRPADKTSSGSPECWGCWNWRKLDGPAARHWAKVTTDFLSNVDAYDYLTFMPNVFEGTDHDFRAMFAAASHLQFITEGLIRCHIAGLPVGQPR